MEFIFLIAAALGVIYMAGYFDKNRIGPKELRQELGTPGYHIRQLAGVAYGILVILIIVVIVMIAKYFS